MPNGVERAGWIDLAKGFAILFVVMHHAGTYGRAVFSLGAGDLDHMWSGIEILLYHVRLPVFFFVSGVLASGHYGRKGSGLAVEGIRRLGRTYLIWSLLLLLLAPAWPLDKMAALPDPAHMLRLFWGDTVAWYLWALVLCFAFVWSTRSMPGALVLIAAFAIAGLAQDLLEDVSVAAKSFARYLPLYVLGARWPQLGARIVALRGFRVVASCILFYLAALTVSGPLTMPFIALDVIGMVIGLLLVGLAQRRIDAHLLWLAWMGRRTLPIYLLHFPVIAVIGCATIRMMPTLPPQHPLATIYVPMLTATAIGVSLLLHAMIRRAGGGWLFAPPPLRAVFASRRGRPEQLAMDGDAA